MLSNGVYLLLNKGDLTWFLRVLMLMKSGVYEQDSNVTQLGNFTLETIQYRKNKTESSDVQIFKIMINPASNQAVISGRAGFEKTAGFRPGPDDIRCNPIINNTQALHHSRIPLYFLSLYFNGHLPGGPG